MTDLLRALEDSGRLNKERIEARVKAVSEEKQKMIAALETEAAKNYNNTPIHGTRLMSEIRDAIPPGTRIVDDCWSYSSLLRRILPLQEAKSYMRSRGGGSIGWGLPGAIGVKMASPDRPVACISGDGSAMWSIQSLWTAAHYNIPVTFIVISNGAYRQVRMMKTVLMGEAGKGRHLGTDLENPRNDFCKLAEGMGLVAQRVETPEELRNALQKAFSISRPNLIDVTVDGSL